MEPQKHALSEILTLSPILSQIVQKVEQLAKLNRIVHQKLAPELAKHCRVANYRDGILILTTDSPATGHLLRFAKSELLTALRALPEWCHLKSIKIHVRPSQRGPEIAPSATPSAPTLSLNIANDLKAAALNINDEALRQALLRLSSSRRV